MCFSTCSLQNAFQILNIYHNSAGSLLRAGEMLFIFSITFCLLEPPNNNQGHILNAKGLVLQQGITQGLLQHSWDTRLTLLDMDGVIPTPGSWESSSAPHMQLKLDGQDSANTLVNIAEQSPCSWRGCRSSCQLGSVRPALFIPVWNLAQNSPNAKGTRDLFRRLRRAKGYKQAVLFP